ncbi:MAG: TRAP transporter substrate-binding protein DctP, partial [Eubacteriales bacterium]|nr:TRAP transporter substrate-binding protein DctP [Eubacteriales bacterium]
LKIATVGNESHQSTIAATAFQEKLEELAGDRFDITIYPNAQLGGEREMAEGVKIGSIELAVVTSDGALPSFVPEMQVLAIPYLFSDKAEAYYALDNYLQEELQPKFEEQGFKHLAFCELGFRHFTNNKREITKAEDMKGLSIRVQESPIWFALADHLNFIATPIAFNELYTALQQGTVDGQENPIASISSSAFDEVQKYMCLDGHTYGPESMIMNLNFYNQLTDEEKAWVDEAAEYARDTQRQAVTDMEEGMLEAIEAKGVKVCHDPDLDSFQQATADLYLDPAVTAMVPPELTDGVKAAVEEYRTEYAADEP